MVTPDRRRRAVVVLQERIVIEDWRNEYNTWRPHSSLGGLTPAEYAANWTPKTPEPLP